MSWAARLAVLVLVTAPAGCGTARQAGGSGSRALFAQACGGCHTLSGADSPTHQGGDLLGLRLSRPVMLQFAREMPTRHRVTSAQLQAITNYILAVQEHSR